MISAFSVSCGTRLAPRNSKASITCPLGFTVGAASALGVSNCGRWHGWAAGAAGAAAGAAGGVAGGVGAGAGGIVSKGLGVGGGAARVAAAGAAGGVAGGVGAGAVGIVSKGLGFGGVAGGVCCRGCAGGWPAGGCWAGVWANIAGQMEMTQKQTGITTRRRRLKSFMRAYLSTLRGYDDVETQATVSLLQLRFQRFQRW